MKFQEIIDDGVKVISSFGKKDDMMPHLLCCVNVPFVPKLEEMILAALKKNGVPLAIRTILTMERLGLITKEKSKAAYAGKLKKDIYWLSVGHSATAFRNFAIRQLSIPQNYIWQRDQIAKTFGKKCFAINQSEN